MGRLLRVQPPGAWIRVNKRLGGLRKPVKEAAS
jgi:hypothetical protein